MEKTFLQVRTDTKDKEQASAILEELGTNLSSVVNMLLKQIILTKSIPFEIKIPHVYTSEEQITEVSASMAMEQMPLNKEDVRLLKKYQEAKDKETIRQQILGHYRETTK
ncbi:type II toxin-antitoxin system RelB/DinJ family antitoxin [Enterocloster lavalensis]|uniref:Addiction module antitoxin, RelB/DinJ family n=1 Tax=Enterocloster lavalensis TaxID=460384 RepID=A0A1I0EBU3_9FIRM|nr:type II toxin-antitoxin system RelB/DinJ family antitoxin [Enterocloster lavalensis]PST30857.1 type II toxin-antitoxin system antitoxin, RelB/DinJ family [Enterocloster lavalensis]SET42532.1 addiction module antitoxin, RelB/DinJ family [Enterocloster lavalensis]